MECKGYDEIVFDNDVEINTSNFDSIFAYVDTSVEYKGTSQWVLQEIDDFEGKTNTWSSDKLSQCGSDENMFLGGHCNFGTLEVKKTYKDIPTHKFIRIKANFHFFDQWEEDLAYMNFNNSIIWSEQYSWCESVMVRNCKKYGINVCGDEYPDRLSIPIEAVIEHNETSFELVFGAMIKKDACKASWGIDDIQIYFK
jgi:hypothetical protein